MDECATRKRRVQPRAPAMLSFILAAAVLVTGACAPSPEAARPLNTDVVLEVTRAPEVPPGELYFKAVPGGLLGPAADAEVFRSAPLEGELRLPLDALLARLDAHAAPARIDASNPGELITPREARIARLGTFFTATEATGCRGFRTGLRAATGNALLLYVDRPARVSGSRYTSPYIMDYALDFPAAGLYAISLRRTGPRITHGPARSDGLVAHVEADCGSR